MASLDSFKCRRELSVGGQTFVYYSLPEAEKNGLGDISKLPVSLKVLLENLLRKEDGWAVKKEDILAVAPEDRMFTHVQDDVQVPRFAAAPPRLTLARHPQP